MSSDVPNHLAIIMDGNRRWARSHRLEALVGHDKGAQVLRFIVKDCAKVDINWLTVFAFSSENWRRPQQEVNGLMRLMEGFIKTQTQEFLESNVRLRIIGRRDRFSQSLCALIRDVEERSANNTGLNLTVALDYGGQQDIAAAVSRIAEEIEMGILKASDVDDDLLKSRLDTKILPSVDLLIRTGGEQRLSNFLLWDMSYAELFFTAKLWPDFTTEDLYLALAAFKERERRFGGDKDNGQPHLHVVVSD